MAGGKEHVDRGQPPFRLLFLCTGNICRSAYADVVAQGSLPGVEFSSAGIRALVGWPIDPPMAEQVDGRGDPAAHRARQLTRELATDADLILAMEAEHRRFVLDEWPRLGRRAFIIGQVARELGRLPAGIGPAELADHLWRHRTSEPGDEVADPYRRGRRAAVAAAAQIDRHLTAILDGLGSVLERPATDWPGVRAYARSPRGDRGGRRWPPKPQSPGHR